MEPWLSKDDIGCYREIPQRTASLSDLYIESLPRARAGVCVCVCVEVGR